MRYAIVGMLILMSVLAFGGVTRLEFVNYDDDVYITENPAVLKGVSIESMRGTLTAVYGSLWHPVTTLSHQLDVEFFGTNPRGHHITNLILHTANGVLLFLFLFQITGERFPWRSAGVAALFLVHPLSVESVAWVAERKNVLSTFFWILTMWTHVRYTTRPTPLRYAGLLTAFFLGLLSKPMLVSLPIVLLLLDIWPLARFSPDNPRGIWNLILEKIPLFILALVFCVITYLFQLKAGSAVSLAGIGMWTRVENAVVSYVLYVGKIIWPTDLAAIYPHPGRDILLWKFLFSAPVLIYTSVMAVRSIRTAPYFTFGWFWYIVTFIPVIGLVQVGVQAMADRYTYVPVIGIYIAAAWGLPFFIRQKDRKVWIAGAGIFLAALILSTRAQVGVWRNSATLFEHALKATHENSIAHNNLGVALEREGRLTEAIQHYTQALQINPQYATARNNLGSAMARRAEVDAAILHFSEALRINPNYAEAHFNLGVALAQKNKFEAAFREYAEALRIKPSYYKARNNMGLALMKLGRTEEAIGHFLMAIQINSADAKPYYNMGLAEMKLEKIAEAESHFREAIRISPDYAKAHQALGSVLERKRMWDEAGRHYSEALRLDPNLSEARIGLKRIQK